MLRTRRWREKDTVRDPAPALTELQTWQGRRQAHSLRLERPHGDKQGGETAPVAVGGWSGNASLEENACVKAWGGQPPPQTG